MDGVQYAASTDCGLLHVNGTVLQVLRIVMRGAGVVDAELEAYGSWQERVFYHLGLNASVEQLEHWQADADRRAQRSLARREDEYKKRRAVARRKLKEKRNGERKVASKMHTYKAEAEVDGDCLGIGLGKGKGVPMGELSINLVVQCNTLNSKFA